jgi:hypothetical protein
MLNLIKMSKKRKQMTNLKNQISALHLQTKRKKVRKKRMRTKQNLESILIATRKRKMSL